MMYNLFTLLKMISVFKNDECHIKYYISRSLVTMNKKNKASGLLIKGMWSWLCSTKIYEGP